MRYKHIFVESNRDGYPTSIFTESELEFIKSKELIDVKRGGSFIPSFVGEFITPDGSYFSLPKNFEPNIENIDLFKKVLSRYKDLKGKDGKTLLTNNSFSVSKEGELKSDKFYYNELKEFFLDYITYEYIYPRELIKKHSTNPISGGKIDVLSTMRNRKQKGPGITYNTKDIKNTKEWNIDDIYWSTLMYLSKKYGNSDDMSQILEMKEFLEDQGYILNIVNLDDNIKIIKDINRCDVGIIHQPIKNTLLDYYNSISIDEKFTINAFYTLKFQYVWEELVRESLKHSEDFKDEIKEVFIDYKPTRRRFEEGDEAKQYRDLMPDLFSSYNNKYYIGDAKYYQEVDNSHFDKEMYVYNQLIDNKYPMCVFIPGRNTRRVDVREQGPFELIVFRISVEEAISDAINKSNNTIDKVHQLISKNTKRDF